MVLEFGRYAYCVGERMLLVRRWSISWVLMAVSNTFAMMGSKDIGR